MMIKKYLLSFIFFFACCCQNKIDTSFPPKDRLKDGCIYSDGKMQFQFIFPDTVFINKSYTGKVKYKSILDTITPKFEFINGKISRYVNFPYAITKDSLTTSEVKKLKFDTIGAFNNRTILLSGFKFNQIGTFFINGLIFDQVLIPQSNPELTRIIDYECRATHKVIVVDKE